VQCEYTDLFTPSQSLVQQHVNLAPISPRGPVNLISLARSLQTYELELLYHWVISTSLVVGRNRGPDRERIWQTVIPQLGQSNDFLGHMVLATAAAHLTTLFQQSEERIYHYRCMALYHHIKATSRFQQALGPGSNHSPPESAILPFGILAMFTTLALLPQSTGSDSNTTDLNYFIGWLVFTQRSIAFALSCLQRDLMVHETTGLVSHFSGRNSDGPTRHLAADDPLDGSLLSSLDQLASLIIASSSTSFSSSNSETLLLAIAKTKLWFRLLPLRPQNHSHLVLWVGSMSNEFFNLVQLKCPLALALTAHWIVPLYHAPRLWFISHWPKPVIEAITDELTTSGMSESISWVRKEIGTLQHKNQSNFVEKQN
jgi:hypothetical protein